MVPTLVHINYVLHRCELRHPLTQIKHRTQTKKYLYVPSKFQYIWQRSQKSWLYIMCNNIWLNNIYIYCNNKTLSYLNRKAFKCIIYINFVSASNNCLVLQKTLIYHRLQKKTIHFILFFIYFNTFVSLMGPHITWMKFVLHAPYSKFCKYGLTIVHWPKHVVRLGMTT